MYGGAVLPQQQLHPWETLRIDCLVRHTHNTREHFHHKLFCSSREILNKGQQRQQLLTNIFFFFFTSRSRPSCVCSSLQRLHENNLPLSLQPDVLAWYSQKDSHRVLPFPCNTVLVVLSLHCALTHTCSVRLSHCDWLGIGMCWVTWQGGRWSRPTL